MVKLINRTELSKRIISNLDDLEQTARDMFHNSEIERNGSYVMTILTHGVKSIPDRYANEIKVDLSPIDFINYIPRRVISIVDKRAYENALALAQAYENEQSLPFVLQHS